MEWLKALLEKATITDGKLDIDSLLKAIKEEFPKNAVPKSEFNSLNETKKELEKQIGDRDKQLKDLQDKAKGNEELEKTIKDLQEANKTTKEQYESKIKDMTISAAIQSKLTDTKYPELLTTKFDKSKLVIGTDGTVSGIDEQLTTLKETYKDLFVPNVSGKNPNNSGGSLGNKTEIEQLQEQLKTAKRLDERIAINNQIFKLQKEQKE